MLTILSIRFILSYFKKKTQGDFSGDRNSSDLQSKLLAFIPSLPRRQIVTTLGITLISTILFLGAILIAHYYLNEKPNNNNQQSGSLIKPVAALTLADSSFHQAIAQTPVEFSLEDKVLPKEERYIDKWNDVQAFFNEKRDLFLHWSTHSSYPTDIFEIERGRKFDEWEVFEKVESIRNPGMLRFFSIVDSTIQKGSTFYRIKKIKPNGDYSFSKILQVHIP